MFSCDYSYTSNVLWYFNFTTKFHFTKWEMFSWGYSYTSNVLWYFNFTTKIKFTKMVKVGDVFYHDSSCSAQTNLVVLGGIHILGCVCTSALQERLRNQTKNFKKSIVM